MTRTTQLLTLFFLSRYLFNAIAPVSPLQKECLPSSQYQPLTTSISMPNGTGTINEDENHTLHLSTLELMIPLSKVKQWCPRIDYVLRWRLEGAGRFEAGYMLGTCIWPFRAYLQLPLYPNTPTTSQDLPKLMEYCLHPQMSQPPFAVAICHQRWRWVWWGWPIYTIQSHNNAWRCRVAPNDNSQCQMTNASAQKQTPTPNDKLRSPMMQEDPHLWTLAADNPILAIMTSAHEWRPPTRYNPPPANCSHQRQGTILTRERLTFMTSTTCSPCESEGGQ